MYLVCSKGGKESNPGLYGERKMVRFLLLIITFLCYSALIPGDLNTLTEPFNSPHRTDFLSCRFSFLTHMNLTKQKK